MKKVSILLLLTLIVGCEEKRTPIVHNIPENFTGSLVVVYEEKGFPELTIKNEKYELNFPRSGIIITSSTQEYGWAKDSYFYIKKNGDKEEVDSYFSDKGVSIQGGGTGSAMNENRSYSYSEIFIGTKDDYDQLQPKDNLFERIEKEIERTRK